jgi:L-asparagine transporter-like permease
MKVDVRPNHSHARLRAGGRSGFHRDLGPAGLVLLTIGGVMGSGLFLASGIVLSRSGPSALVLYAVGALAMSLEILALGEMAAADPEPGSFLVYARRVFGPGLVFVAGWIFWLSSVLTMSSEVTAAALFTRFWWPAVPLWLWALAYSAGIVAANFASVRGFGQIESAMAAVKVFAVAAFIVVAAGAFAHLWPRPALAVPSAPRLWHESWWPRGVAPPLASFILVLFAYAGTGVIGLAAGETREPPVTIPRALAGIVPTITVLYLGAVFALLALVPRHAFSSATSPFVVALARLGLPDASTVMNAVLLLAVLSTMNAALYSNSRVLYSLGQSGEAPDAVARLNARGIPATAIWWSAGLLAGTIVLAYLLPSRAYSELVTATGFQAMFIWVVVLLTHLRYRRYLQERGRLGFRLRGYPWTTYACLALVLFGMGASFLATEERVGLALAAASIGAAAGAWLVVRRRPAPH